MDLMKSGPNGTAGSGTETLSGLNKSPCNVPVYPKLVSIKEYTGDRNRRWTTLASDHIQPAVLLWLERSVLNTCVSHLASQIFEKVSFGTNTASKLIPRSWLTNQ